MEEKLISLAILLFILSLISERIANFIKLRVEEGKTFSIYIRRFTFRTKEESTKTEWERFNMKLSILCGFAVALILKADIIEILSANADEDFTHIFSWKGYSFDLSLEGIGLFFKIILGCVLTGFFLSLGSKFWHDLVDLLLQVKNLKKKANDRATYEIENVKELDEYIKYTEGEIARLAIKQNYEKIAEQSNFRNLFVGYKVINGEKRKIPILDIKDEDISNYPRKLEYTLPKGTQRSIPLEIVRNVGNVKASYDPGNGIYTSTSHLGTYGCTLKRTVDNKLYALTCAHVLFEGNYDAAFCSGFLSNTKRTKVGRNIIGDWVFASQSVFYDYGTVELNSGSVNKIKPSGMKPKPVGYQELAIGSNVTFMGNGTQKASGKVLGFMEERDYEWFGFRNQSVKMRGMIKIGEPVATNYSRSISTAMDSGAILYDDDLRPVGMIVGYNDNYTYAIFMDWICEDFDSTVY